LHDSISVAVQIAAADFRRRSSCVTENPKPDLRASIVVGSPVVHFPESPASHRHFRKQRLELQPTKV